MCQHNSIKTFWWEHFSNKMQPTIYALRLASTETNENRKILNIGERWQKFAWISIPICPCDNQVKLVDNLGYKFAILKFSLSPRKLLFYLLVWVKCFQTFVKCFLWKVLSCMNWFWQLNAGVPTTYVLLFKPNSFGILWLSAPAIWKDIL